MHPSPSTDAGAVEYLLSPAGERFISLMLAPDVFITVGPFLSEEIPDHYISQLVRSGIIRIHHKEELKSFFDDLPVLSIPQHYYTGQLLEMLFSLPLKETGNPTETPISQSFLPNSFYLHTHDYRTRQFVHSPYITEQEICHYISNGDSASALRILSEINHRPRAQLAGTTLRSLKNSIICSCAFMTRAAISGGVRPDDAFTLSDDYIQRIENCNDISAIIHFEEKMVVGFTVAVNSLKIGRYSRSIIQAISFIENHLCEKLTLEQIAEAVFLNPNYLSSLFSHETGETVHNFILRRRIEDSSFFIRCSTESIADIASFYQFSSQSHFVQCFKRYMSTTPGAYRKNFSDRS